MLEFISIQHQHTLVSRSSAPSQMSRSQKSKRASAAKTQSRPDKSLTGWWDEGLVYCKGTGVSMVTVSFTRSCCLLGKITISDHFLVLNYKCSFTLFLSGGVKGALLITSFFSSVCSLSNKGNILHKCHAWKVYISNFQCSRCIMTIINTISPNQASG